MDCYPIGDMTADYVRSMLLVGGNRKRGGAEAKSPEKVISYHVMFMLCDNMEQLLPIDQIKLDKWKEHMDVCREYVRTLVEERLNISLSDGIPVIQKIARKDVARYAPILDEIFIEMVDILGTFSTKRFSYVEQPSKRFDGKKRWFANYQMIIHHPNMLGGLLEDEVSHLQKMKEKYLLLRQKAVAVNILVLEDMEFGITNFMLNILSGKIFLGGDLYEALKPKEFVALEGSLKETRPSKFKIEDLIGPSEVREVATPGLSPIEHELAREASERNNKLQAFLMQAKLEKVLHIWKRKMRAKPSKFEKYSKRMLNARYLLQSIRTHYKTYSGVSSFTTEKIKLNKDVGRAYLEKYSRTMEKLTSEVMRLISDVQKKIDEGA